jgi:8-oxo-dGTP pyrophosphatase MutT (NUDIX family)
MKISAGILIVFNDKLLLCHPTNASWTNTFSPPKGLTEDDEDLIDAAIRECKEEVGISITRDKIVDRFFIPYRKGRNLFKKVYLFRVDIKSLSEIGLDSEVIPKEKLQLEEVDWAGFVTKSEVEEKIFWRFKPILSEIFN